MTSDYTSLFGGDREAKPDELCSCGDQAKVIFETAKFGDVGYCGVPHGGRMAGSDDAVTDKDAGDVVVLRSEVTCPSTIAERAEKVADQVYRAAMELAPTLEELAKLMCERENLWNALGYGDDQNDQFEQAIEPTGIDAAERLARSLMSWLEEALDAAKQREAYNDTGKVSGPWGGAVVRIEEVPA